MEKLKVFLRTIGKMAGCCIMLLGVGGIIAEDYALAIAVIAVGIIILFLSFRRSPKAKEVQQKAKQVESARPKMPAASVRVVSSRNESGGGMYEYDYDNIGIYRPDTLSLPLPPVGAVLTFENDPTNAYDDKAIKAVWNGQTVGWLYRKGKREMIRDWINNGWYYVAEVTKNDPELSFWIGMNRE